MKLVELERRADKTSRAARMKRLAFQQHIDRSTRMVKDRISSPLGLGLVFGLGIVAGSGSRRPRGEPAASRDGLRKSSQRIAERAATSVVTALLFGQFLGRPEDPDQARPACRPSG